MRDLEDDSSISMTPEIISRLKQLINKDKLGIERGKN
jgi:hypothetical protein